MGVRVLLGAPAFAKASAGWATFFKELILIVKEILFFIKAKAVHPFGNTQDKLLLGDGWE